ncbi:TraB/GumN family protein [Asticcacaulis sp.]|uniref:TraB/GumN family protein n=1 Tax=Asticcacaulis sp. TaxID=1872648 RepID=UPI002638AA31|nr:TraB/GumN family protein [Asticcacaulis sp.]
MLKSIVFAAALVAAAGSACAQTSVTLTPAADDWALTEVSVVKNLPGPALWKVIKDDKVVWLIGDLRIDATKTWDSARIDRILSDAEGLYLPPAPKFGLLALYAVMSGKDLPGSQTLRDVLPPAEYARWAQLARTYEIDTRDIEKDRPLWAGVRFLDAVSTKKGFSSQAISQHLTQVAKRHKVKVARISRMETRALVKQTNAIDEAEGRRCLSGMLDLTEYMVATTAAQTDAWANGEVGGLKAILRAQPKADCHEALGGQLRAKWTADTLRMVDTAMQGTRRSVLLLPVPLLLDERLVNELRAQGYQVRTPG